MYKKNKYAVVKNAVSKELSEFIYNYFKLKRKVVHTLYTDNFIKPNTCLLGIWNDPQAQNTYSHYSDIVMETLLIKLHSLIEKTTELDLYMNYSYARLYKQGDILKRHKDRSSCEISTTIAIGGDPWTIYLESTNEGNKEVGINLEIGDMLVYKGNELKHWREPLEGKECGQVFLHYINKKTEGADKREFDSRRHLGLPDEYCKVPFE
tara:strand:+ start:1302 stop:1925 length:624 start_codon:yes stop_codon:yes gene_type:complete